MIEWLEHLSQATLDASIIAVRILLPLYAVFIVYQIFVSMRRHRRPEKPLICLFDNETGEKIPVLFWENSIGRSKGSDITVNDMAVSRDHCVLLRRETGWYINDVGSKGGTFVNGKETFGRSRVLIDDEITVGGTTFTMLRGDEYDEEIRSSWFFSKKSDKPSIKQYKLMIMITVFQFLMGIEASMSVYSEDYQPLIVCTVLTVIEWIVFIVSTIVFRRTTFEIESLAIFLTGISVMLLVRQELKSAYVQIIAAAMGIALYMFIIKIIENPDKIAKWRLIIMVGAVGLLAINLVFGKVQNGAANWITIGSISVQPSEIVKILYVFVGASALDQLMTKRNLLEFIVFSAICVGALALMGDFGTAVIFFMTFLLIAFMRSGDFKTLLLALAGAVFAGAIVLKFKPYVTKRFEAWGHVWEHAQDTAYQQARVLTYIASGGLFGVGIGNGCLKYIAASESDLVFGLVSEEMGIIVGLAILGGIIGLVFYTRAITTRSRSTFYSISACSAAGLFLIQMALNVFGATDILPLTGVTLPFVSAGGTSMISCWGLLAFIKAADERTYSAKRK